MPNNPFQGDDGSAGGSGQLPANAKNICPCGIQTLLVPRVPQNGIIHDQMPQLEVRINYPVCVEDRCSWWDADEECCHVKSASMRLSALEEILDDVRTGLEPLRTMFGGKK
jgi:hypothetical protein